MSQIPETYIVRKYPDGWVIRDPKTGSINFLTQDQLIQRGLISPTPRNYQLPSSTSRAIIVPNGQEVQRSLSIRSQNDNWRNHPDPPSLSRSAP